MKTIVLTSLALTVSMLCVTPVARAEKRDRAGVAAAEQAATMQWRKLLGSSVPDSRIPVLSSVFTAADGSDLSQRFVADAKAEGAPQRYVADGIAVKIDLPNAQPFNLESARILLEPAADGRSLRFEIEGAAFGSAAGSAASSSASMLRADGTVTWSAGPLGGDKLTGKLQLAGADVVALRAAMPERFDPSFGGQLTIDIEADGIVAEATTEDAPASPLRGKASGSIGWNLLGRSSPMQFSTDFSLDDKLLRISNGRMSWQGQTLDVKGSAGIVPNAAFRLVGTFAGVDAGKVATDWNVPEPWRPQAVLGGTIEFYGKPGESFISYDTTAPDLVVPAMSGYTIRTGKVQLLGRLAAINGAVIATVRPANLHVGPFDLGQATFGLRFFRDQLQATIANTKIWANEGSVTATYEPPNHPVAEFSGHIGPMPAGDLASRVVPWLALDVEGQAEASFRSGQDAAYKPHLTARAGIRNARWGNSNLFGSVLTAIAAADPALASSDPSAMAPAHPSGRGTPAERLMFDVEREGEGYKIGGVLIRSGDQQIEAAGTATSIGEVQLHGHAYLPPQIADRLASSAPWVKSLRVAPDGGMFVPILIHGAAASPSVSLDPGYVELIGRARTGEAVTPPGNTAIARVTDERLPGLSYDNE